MSIFYIQVISGLFALFFLSGVIIDHVRFGWFGKSLMHFYTMMAQLFLSVFVLTLNISFPRWTASSSLLMILSFELALILLLMSDRGEQKKQKRASTRIPIIGFLLAINFFEYHWIMFILYFLLIVTLLWILKDQFLSLWQMMLIAQCVLVPVFFNQFSPMVEWPPFWIWILLIAHSIFLRRFINAALIKIGNTDKIG
jgi:hypothetical protein